MVNDGWTEGLGKTSQARGGGLGGRGTRLLGEEERGHNLR